MVIPRLACEFSMCQKEAGNVAVRTKDALMRGVIINNVKEVGLVLC